MQPTPHQGSDNIEIKRSQINPASYNPRKISDKNRALLKKNIKANGLLGGIIWNRKTGNLVSGHQRLSIVDELEKYDHITTENDYLIRVDVVEVDEKTEKELNIAMNNRNLQGEYDLQMIKSLIPDIDYKAAGLDEIDLNMMGITIDVGAQSAADEIVNDMQALTKPAEDKKAAVKQAKADIKQKAQEKVEEQDAFVMLSFSTAEAKNDFLERFGFEQDQRYIKGEEFSEMVERID